MKRFRMSLRNNLKSSVLFIFILIIFIGSNIYYHNTHPYYDFYSFLYSVFLVSIWIIPITFVHFEYLKHNWQAILEVDNANNKLRYWDKGKKVEANFDDLNKFIEHKVKSHALLYGFYKYYEIYLDSGEILIISNLIARELSIPGVEKQIKERYIPSVFLDRRFGSWKLDLKEKGKTFQPSESLINRFEKRYQNYSQDRLIHIMNNEDYRYEAQIAAKNLLEKVQKKA